MPNIDLSILNQRQTPAFYADTLANRPAAGFVGRIFVSTNTLDLYRDNGTTWDLLSPSSTGTITGSGAAGQVTYFSAASSITGSNNLFWDTTNNRLGVNTNAPTASLDVHSASNTIAQFNQTVATNDTRIAFQNGGSSLWRIGNLYNAGANDFEIFDVVGALQSLTVKKTTGQILIGTTTVGSGKLVVSSTTSDNGVQIVGASAPSLRIDNAASGPTKRAGFGISTAANNFIQGSVDRDFCMFNGSTTASPILFGIYDTTNVVEAARISAARNFIVGSSVDAGFKFDVNGSARVTGAVYADNTIRVGVGIIGTSSNNLALSSNTTGGEISFWNNQIANRLMTLTGVGNLGINKSNPTRNLEILASTSNNAIIKLDATTANGYGAQIEYWSKTTGGTTNTWVVGTGITQGNNNFEFWNGSTSIMSATISGNILIGTTTDAGQKLQVSGVIKASDYITNSNYGYTETYIDAIYNATKTYTITGNVTGFIQIMVGVYLPGAGTSARALWFGGGFLNGSYLPYSEIVRVNDTYLTISAINSNQFSTQFTIQNTFANTAQIAITIISGSTNQKPNITSA
jgi:hypothetical protein